MDKKKLFGKESRQNIKEISFSKEKKPKARLRLKKLPKGKNPLKMRAEITEFADQFISGLKALVSALISFSESEPDYYTGREKKQLIKLSSCLSTVRTNKRDNLKVKEIWEMTIKSEKLFNKTASLLYESKNYEKASSLYSFLTLIDQQNTVYWMNYGNAELFCQRYHNALDAYSQVAALDQKNPHCYLFSSQCHHELNQIPEAIAAVDKALKVMSSKRGKKQLAKESEKLLLFLKQIAAR